MSWWYRLWHRKEMEQQLEKELRFHLDQHAGDLVTSGRDPVEARRETRLALGGPEQVKELCRDARGTRWLEDLWQDLRYALRTLRQKPGFAAVALLTLALGVGATTIMFTMINGVLLKPLAYPQPERLVTLQEQTEKATQLGNLWAFSYPNFVDCRRESRSLTMAAWIWGGGTVTGPDEAVYADGRQISADMFSVFGVPLVQGRTFLPEEDQPGGAPVAIISANFWMRRYGGSASAIGQSLILDGKPYTIVGVAPAGFQLSGEPDVFTPLGQSVLPRMQFRGAHFLAVIARLQPGVTLASAHAELALIGRRLAQQFPDTNAGRGFLAQSLRQELVRDVRSTLWLLLAAVSLVLLIACVNVASLLLARAVSRERELAMRLALGARRGRLIRQCLTESAVLAISGGALGVLLAAFGIRPFIKFWPGSLPRAEEIQLDWRVLLFALAASLVCGLIFGLAPALRAPARQLEQALRAGARSVTGSSRRLHTGFVVTEIALAVVLLISAGVLGRTLLRLSSLDPGVNLHNVLVTRTALSPAVLQDPARTRAAWQDLLDRARGVAGVESIAMVDTVPMRVGVNELGYWTKAPAPPPGEAPLALATSVTPDYFKVMGIPVRQGRFFDDRDRISTEPVVVLDEVMARRAFGGTDAVGQHLWVAGLGLNSGPVLVVGVVGHVRHWGLAGDDDAAVRDQIYYPFAQVPDPLVRRWSELMSIAVRTSIDPLRVVEPLKHELHGASGDQVLYEVHTMEQLAGASLARQRFLLLLFGIFAGLALLLACIGIYGVLAYLTSQRVPEIGVRMALGADAGQIVWLILRESLVMLALGVSIGAAASWAAVRALTQLVEGARPADPTTVAAMIAMLVAAALMASFVPARRASRVDPLRALRQD